MTQTIAVDFDGVVHAYSRGWQDGSIYDDAIPGAFDALRRLMRRYAVYVHTSRDSSDVAHWINARSGIPTTYSIAPAVEFWDRQDAIYVTKTKLPAVAYIDDRGIRFTDWDNAFHDLALAGYES